MTVEAIALLGGLFIVPLILLAVGKKFRTRSPRVRRAFWYVVIAHTLGALSAIIAMMIPPLHWEGGSITRIAIVYSSMLAASIVAATISLMIKD